jgi:glycosyltransferase involved in cell wall biosynthesis
MNTIDLLAKQPDIDRRIRIRVHGNIVGQSPEFVAQFNATFAKNGFATYAGPYDNADVRNLMAACDYVLIPSTWWENSPVVIQEAYAAGRPVICTGIGGMAEKVPNRRSGLHFRINDATDLARVMGEAADDVMYEALCSGIPEVSDHTTMARDYLATFARLRQYQDGSKVTPELPRATRRRRAGANVAAA